MLVCATYLKRKAVTFLSFIFIVYTLVCKFFQENWIHLNPGKQDAVLGSPSRTALQQLSLGEQGKRKPEKETAKHLFLGREAITMSNKTKCTYVWFISLYVFSTRYLMEP